jgi:hypothetical protein
MLHQMTREMETIPYPLAPTVTNFQEGVALTVIQSNGVSQATIPSAPAATDKFLGVSRSQWNTPTTSVKVETLTVDPTAYTATLSRPLLAATSILVKSGSTVLTTQTNASPASGYVQVTAGSQTLQFNAAQASATVVVTYRFNLTAAEAVALVGNGIPGRSPAEATGVMDVIIRGTVVTDQFDTSVDWSSWANGSNIVVVGANGLFTLAANATANAAVPNAKVIQAPTADLPFLTLYYAA